MNRLILCAGTVEYDCEEFDTLDSVASDVEAIQSIFTRLGYSTPKDGQLVNPTSSELRAALSDLSDATIPNAETHIVVYYSGHGEVHNRYYLTTRDSNAHRLSASAVPAVDIAYALAPLPGVSGSRHVLVLLDTCFSGRAASEAVSTASSIKLTLPDPHDTKFAVISCCRPREEALESRFSLALCTVVERWVKSPDLQLNTEELKDRINAEFVTSGVLQRATHESSSGAIPSSFFFKGREHSNNAGANGVLPKVLSGLEEVVCELAEFSKRAAGVECSMLLPPGEDYCLNSLSGRPSAKANALNEFGDTQVPTELPPLHAMNKSPLEAVCVSAATVPRDRLHFVPARVYLLHGSSDTVAELRRIAWGFTNALGLFERESDCPASLPYSLTFERLVRDSNDALDLFLAPVFLFGCAQKSKGAVKEVPWKGEGLPTKLSSAICLTLCTPIDELASELIASLQAHLTECADDTIDGCEHLPWSARMDTIRSMWGRNGLRWSIIDENGRSL